MFFTATVFDGDEACAEFRVDSYGDAMKAVRIHKETSERDDLDYVITDSHGQVIKPVKYLIKD